MDSAKQEVSLFVVDDNKQRDNATYLGLLQFETYDNDRTKTKGELPISMPKVGNEIGYEVQTAKAIKCISLNVI